MDNLIISIRDFRKEVDEVIKQALHEYGMHDFVITEWNKNPVRLQYPTVGRAANVMGVNEDDILNMLKSKNMHLCSDMGLDFDSIDYLADRYVGKMKDYFYNFFIIKTHTEAEIRDYSLFCLRFSKNGRIVETWNEINEDKLRWYFKRMMYEGSSLLFNEDYYYEIKTDGASGFMRRIVRSFLFHAKFKIHEYLHGGILKMVRLLIMANHFYIFSDDSDSNSGTDSVFEEEMLNNPHEAVPYAMAV